MTLWDRLADGLFQQSRSMPPPWGPAVRTIRYPVALMRDWLAGEINLRAMSLAYTTLLSLVPLMVFVLSIVKGLGARDDLQLIVQEFFRPVGPAAAQLTARVMQFVENMRGGIAGTIGLVLLGYTVITTLEKIEASFNFVWRVVRPRHLARRITEYLSVMIVGSLLMVTILGPLAGIAPLLGRFIPYAIVTAVFTFMYSFVPNTRVRLSAALVGAVCAGFVWALVGQAFTAFILYASHLTAVYTGFAVILTMLVWVYLSWLILLLGADLSFYVQYPQYLRYGQEPIELSGSARELAALSLMYTIGREHAAGRDYWTLNRLAAELDIPGTALAPVVSCLERAGLLTATEKEHFIPARELGDISLAAVLDAVRTQTPGRPFIHVLAAPPAVALLGAIDAATRERLAGSSLKDFIASA